MIHYRDVLRFTLLAVGALLAGWYSVGGPQSSTWLLAAGGFITGVGFGLGFTRVKESKETVTLYRLRLRGQRLVLEQALATLEWLIQDHDHVSKCRACVEYDRIRAYFKRCVAP